jgi:hypothetical protein
VLPSDAVPVCLLDRTGELERKCMERTEMDRLVDA